VEREIRTVRDSAGKNGAVLGGTREGCMGVLNVAFLCVGFEVGVSVGRGLKCVYRHMDMALHTHPPDTRGEGRIGIVPVCDLVG
jgi:hypothetical protein